MRIGAHSPVVVTVMFAGFVRAHGQLSSAASTLWDRFDSQLRPR